MGKPETLYSGGKTGQLGFITVTLLANAALRYPCQFPCQSIARPQVPLGEPTRMREAPKRILCIEDDSETAMLIAEELLDRGFEVNIAYSGQDGLSAIIRERPDLVLSDISMPGMSGFEVLERLMQLAPRFADMPFIFLTALADRDNELRGRRLGADDYVTKPIDFDVLEAIINTRLARGARSAPWPNDVNLSNREIETLTWAARGKTSAEIAQILGRTKRTIDFHLDNARAKLGVANRTQAVMKAVRDRLIKP
jgi:DNA-binding NarL/FixJ family response regulator